MVSLYREDGGLMVGGTGFLQHLTSASQAVKHILKKFADDPGIFEDDVYLLNDSYTAALHTPDVYLISPIHWQGKLAGFVADFVHVNDIGGIDPGGFCPSATSSYHEGFSSQGLETRRTRKAPARTYSRRSSTWCGIPGSSVST